MSRPLTPLALTVLRLLSENPMHPYEMQQEIRRRAYNEAVKVTHGSLYHTVDRLAATGLIEPVETGRAGRRPERTVYAITEAGHDQALALMRELIYQPEKEFPRFGVPLAYLSLLAPDEVIQLLARRAVALEARLAALGSVLDGLAKQGLERIQLLDAEYTQALIRSELEWVRALSEDVKSGRLSWREPTGLEGM